MLQKLNERIQGMVAWIVVILIGITFTLFGVDYFLQSRQNQDVEAKVNNQVIDKNSFETNYQRVRQQKQPNILTAEEDKLLKKQVLEDMIVNIVTVQAAKKLGFTISPEQASAAIVNIPQFQEDGHFSNQRYQQALSNAMFTPQSFSKEVRQGMLLNQQRFCFIGSAFTLPNEVNNFIDLYLQTRDYRYILIPKKLFSDKVKITEDQVQKYYKIHSNEFSAPEKVAIDFIKLSQDDIEKTININAEQVKRYYDDNKDNFLKPAQWKVAHILFSVDKNDSLAHEKNIKKKAQVAYQLLKSNPKQFDSWVSNLSDDKLSVTNQGVLPWFIAGHTPLDKQFAQLKTPGQISSPIRTEAGYEIFKLIAYKPAQLKSLSTVEKEVSTQLKREQAQNKYNQLLEQLTDLSYQSPDSLVPVADSLNLPIKTSSPFSRFGKEDAVSVFGGVVSAAFSTEVLETGNNSEPIQTRNNEVIVLRINKHFPQDKLSLQEASARIIAILTDIQLQQEVQKFGKQLAKLSPQERQQQMSNYSLNWHEIKAASREDNDSVINQLAFEISGVNQWKSKSLENGDYIIAYAMNIYPGQMKKLDPEQQSSLVQQIESSHGIMDYDLYVNSALKEANIVRYNLNRS